MLYSVDEVISRKKELKKQALIFNEYYRYPLLKEFSLSR